MEAKYPDITVKLTETDGNAFAIISKVCMHLRRAGVPAKEIDKFCEEAMDGDYNHLLRTCIEWVEVE